MAIDPNDILVAAYATEGVYEAERQRLIRSAARFGVRVTGYTMDADEAGWLAAVRYKPQFLLDMIACYPGRSILYVDADAVFHADPRAELAELVKATRGKIFARRFDTGEISSGTILLAGPTPNDEIHRFLVEWLAAD